ncbi:pilus assembly FimT family protein [Fervidobacterium thailandense]|uniref:Prepilin-type N-terminal cleavage/methylation domain-containing protein n=1 Tax=Fervidobacterium thailandense TaxID=1008305 RepID=A0A1E3G2G2_9BACT|nr:prepilin-type N-terminal cleavage/methylation domain-containing protein [Fervidobacterium thailandense]ODN30481.1 hypothetical protein A4H02_05490 [Fervidobacterium thailandense]
MKVRKGYTMTELMVGLVIIAIVLGISIPALYILATRLPTEATITTASERVLFLLADGRLLSISAEQPVKFRFSKISNGFLFQVFVDKELDGVPDDPNSVKEARLTTTEDRSYGEMKILFNGLELSNLEDFYIYDGVFIKYAQQNSSTEYSNYRIDFVLRNLRRSIVIRDSMPKIEETGR